MAFLVSAFVLAIGIALVVVATRRTKRAASGEVHVGGQVFALQCSVCEHDLSVTRKLLVPLSTTETGLVVRASPNVSGRKLGEFVCPHCEASHVFITDARVLAYVGANPYSPQQSPHRCQQCRKPIRTPVWARGAYDGRLHEASTVPGDFGLVCPKCEAVSCVECCTKAAQPGSPPRTYACPRCGKVPLDTVFHP